jgi:hypothetical protein
VDLSFGFVSTVDDRVEQLDRGDLPGAQPGPGLDDGEIVETSFLGQLLTFHADK